MSANQKHDTFNTGGAEVIAVCVSTGGVPKLPVESAEVGVDGLAGDGHDHPKHGGPRRAVLIQDIELLEDLKSEGYDVGPGIIGENITARGLDVQNMSPGDRLIFSDGGPVLELTEVRRPCFVLDKIHPTIKEAAVGRCGFLAKVAKTGSLKPGQKISVDRVVTAKD